MSLMELERYPEEIAKAERAVLAQSQEVRLAAEALEQHKADIRGMVANDPTLTNEAKRKSMEAELLLEPEALALIERVQAVQDKLAELRIEVALLQNCFGVVRLLKQEEIAAMGLAAA